MTKTDADVCATVIGWRLPTRVGITPTGIAGILSMSGGPIWHEAHLEVTECPHAQRTDPIVVADVGSF